MPGSHGQVCMNQKVCVSVFKHPPSPRREVPFVCLFNSGWDYPKSGVVTRVLGGVFSPRLHLPCHSFAIICECSLSALLLRCFASFRLLPLLPRLRPLFVGLRAIILQILVQERSPCGAMKSETLMAFAVVNIWCGRFVQKRDGNTNQIAFGTNLKWCYIANQPKLLCPATQGGTQENRMGNGGQSGLHIYDMGRWQWTKRTVRFADRVYRPPYYENLYWAIYRMGYEHAGIVVNVQRRLKKACPGARWILDANFYQPNP